MTAALVGTVTVTCIDCGEQREVKARSDRIAKRCPPCGQKYRSRNRRQELPSKAPKNGFNDAQAVLQITLACRDYTDVIGGHEEALEHIGIGPRYDRAVQEAAIDADEICRDCPIEQACRRAARIEKYTGIAGRRVFKNGKQEKP